jgi:hypothetical protein
MARVITESQAIKDEILELSQLAVRPLISFEVLHHGEIFVFERAEIHPHLDITTVNDYNLMYFYPGFPLHLQEERDFYNSKGLLAFIDTANVPVFAASLDGAHRRIIKLWIHWI